MHAKSLEKFISGWLPLEPMLVLGREIAVSLWSSTLMFELNVAGALKEEVESGMEEMLGSENFKNGFVASFVWGELAAY